MITNYRMNIRKFRNSIFDFEWQIIISYINFEFEEVANEEDTHYIFRGSHNNIFCEYGFID